MLRLNNLGRKSLAELEQLIAEGCVPPSPDVQPGRCVQTSDSPGSRTSGNDPEESSLSDEDDELRRLPLDAFLLRQRSVSTRLMNAISGAVSAASCPFQTVADYLRCNTRQAELLKIENLGRGSASEFEQLVRRSLTGNGTLSIRAVTNDFGYSHVGSLVKEALALLSESQLEVIVGRFFERKTLDAVASIRGVTRERVRQIEAKALRVISTRCGAALRESAKNNYQRLCDSRLLELSLEVFSNLTTCEPREATVYLGFLKKLDEAHSTLSLYESHVYVPSCFLPREKWPEALTAELRTQPLPLTLDRVLQSIRSVPGFFIREYFQRRWGSDLDDASGAAKSYGTSRMCIDVLRKAGRPLHTSDVRARLFASFQVDIEEHAINATLGRLSEVIITGPGTYSLYENLPYSSAQIESIRTTAHEYLVSRGVFLSSKVLFDQAFAVKRGEYPDDLNHYLVMGVAQDDERFTTKRGNMIGLTAFDLTVAYTPLQEEIRKIVLDHGPITLQEITERLSDTRRFCNDSGIRLVLNQSPDIIRIGRQTFDSLHRFFETRESYDGLLLAIRISLLGKRKTTYAVTQDLERLSIPKVTSHLVESVLLSMDDVTSGGDFHELTTPTDELSDYNTAVVHSLKSHSPVEGARAALARMIPPERLAKLISLDTRLLIGSNPSSLATERTELAAILREFDF